jgi:hypothetical protein
MASIKLKGDTSGEITIDVPAVAGTNTLTLPATTGNVVTDSATQTLTNKTLTTPNIDSAEFATVSGTAPLYAARAWVNFNGTGTVAIRESGNVSSITDNTTGDYTINFTTAMPDANYSVSGTSSSFSIATVRGIFVNTSTAPSTTSVRVQNSNYVSAEDPVYANIQIFR